ncbi:ECF RNA polymerase sigma factor SigE [Aquisphaera giovannonii]|uniref:ECF RNA polymerase sigma factor SigE n=1 Tax=Aquisphaera giovannonii TaxID=406548 RepID=A0A5B9W826_9BACT|nr:RNA polymerase sigma factor [Aquisphaera giovannonii]QEH36289.1 ECF RNA polymerase sigma factor SigE [Aquisphaera giovannonii]
MGALFNEGTTCGLSDGQLLERFVDGRGEARERAFATLVARHGPMVIGTCRAIVGDEHEAMDAFQTTFLVLARAGRSLWVRDSLGPWLHRVACRAAIRTRTEAGRRMALARRYLEAMTEPRRADCEDGRAADVHEEIDRLPGRFRMPLVLCDLEDHTYEEAARRLGWSVGMVKSRLARARGRLRDRLTRRGLAPCIAGSPHAISRLIPGATRGDVPVEAAARAAMCLVEGRAATGVAGVAEALSRGMTTTMRINRLLQVSIAATACLVIASGAGSLAFRAMATPHPGGPIKGPAAPPGPPELAVDDRGAMGDPAPGQAEARELALKVLGQAASLDRLARFRYRVRYRHGVVDSMRAVDRSINGLRHGLTAPVLEKDWIGWYQTRFAWDEERFIWELRPGETRMNLDARFWTRADAWERHEAHDGSSVDLVRQSGPAQPWKDLVYFDYGYLRVAPHRFWWGRTIGRGNAQTMSTLAPEDTRWDRLGVARFADEACDVVDSPARGQRLWIGRDSRRIRGVLTYWSEEDAARMSTFFKSDAVRRIAGKAFRTQFDYANWRHSEASEDQLIEIARASAALYPPRPSRGIEPNELIQLDDYREVTPGVWLPFRELRCFPHASEAVAGKNQIVRSELIVEEAGVGLSLADRFAELLPRDGQHVQDQRFAVPIDYEYRAGLDDEALRKRADAESAKRPRDGRPATR